MRVSKQAAAENRRRILTAAARLFREHGIDGAGVDAITEAAGLTHGAFYSQFESKEAVVAEALRLVLDESRESMGARRERQGQERRPREDHRPLLVTAPSGFARRRLCGRGARLGHRSSAEEDS